nr:putative transposase (putative), gypsy type [Tanacetum cinerariifolium]
MSEHMCVNIVHPQLPSLKQMIHEMPVRKIDVYNRFFEYANFRLPLSTFLVNVLRNFRISLSQLSVIAAAKVSHFDILCRVHSIKPTVSLASFSWHTDMDLFAFIQVVDPTKIKVVERECAEGEAKLLDSIIGRVHGIGDSAADGGHDADIKLVTAGEDVAAVAAERAIGDSILNVEVGVEAMATLPLVTYSVSTTPRREDDSSHHSSTHASRAEVDSIIRFVVLPPVMTEAVVTSHAASDPSIPWQRWVPRLPLRFMPLCFMTLTLRRHLCPIMDVLNDSLLDDSDVSWEFIDHLAPPALFYQIREIDYHHLFTEFNVGTACQACLNAEVRILTEYCLSERSRLESECKKQGALLKARDDEIENLKAQLLQKEAEATKDLELKDLNIGVYSLKSQNDGLVDQTTCSSLRDQVSGYERLKEQIEEFQDAQMNIVNDKVANLDANLWNMALYVEEKFYPHILTSIFGRRWLLTRVLKLAVVKCLNSPKYLTASGSTISRAIKKGMQKAPRGGFPFTFQAKLSQECKCCEYYGSVPGISDLQPDVEQLTLLIYRPKDQVVLGETSLSFALSVAHSRVEKIRENFVAPCCVVTTTALSTTFASASSVPPITTNYYEIVSVDGQEDALGNVKGNVAFSPQLNLRRKS